MIKKRTTLDSIFPLEENATEMKNTQSSSKKSAKEKKTARTEDIPEKRANIKKQTLYLKPSLHQQLRVLAFEEEKKMHDLFLEAIDLLFSNRGLPSIEECLKKNGDANRN